SLNMDAAGNLYGTTQFGGAFTGGTVFKLAPDGTETVLHDFSGAEGAIPGAGLIVGATGYPIIGTTSSGGTPGDGVVFALFRRPRPFAGYRYRRLHNFGGTDGAHSYADLIVDAAGNLYGTTYDGGTSSAGVVFKLAPDGTETVLHNFCYGC